MTTKTRRKNGKRNALQTALTLAAALGLWGAAAIGVEQAWAQRTTPRVYRCERSDSFRVYSRRGRLVVVPTVPAAPSTSGDLSDELVDKIADRVVEKLRDSDVFSEDAIRRAAQKVVAEATSVSTPAISSNETNETDEAETPVRHELASANLPNETNEAETPVRPELASANLPNEAGDPTPAASDVVSFSPSDFLSSVPRSSAESERLYLEGRALRYGLNGSKVDRKRGLELLEEAMELGSLNAQAEVALAYCNADVILDRFSRVAIMMEAEGDDIYQKICDLAFTPAQLGNPFAQHALSFALEALEKESLLESEMNELLDFDFDSKNQREANEWREKAFEGFRKLADVGDSVAASYAGVCCMWDTTADVPIDVNAAPKTDILGNLTPNEAAFEKALPWFRQAADANCALGIRLWAELCLLNGKVDEAKALCLRAAETGDLAAAELMATQEGIDVDDATREKFLKKILESDDSTAAISTAISLSSAGSESVETIEKTTALLEKAAEDGRVGAMMLLAEIKGGIPAVGLEPDYAAARAWLAKAAAADHPLAALELVRNYRLGLTENEFQLDLAEERKLIAKAIRGGAGGWTLLGLTYAETDDWEKANRCFLLACENGERQFELERSPACYLAESYEQGRGVGQSFEKANFYYEEAVQWANDPFAMAGLGVNYANGNGVDQSWDKANEWYQKAADAGNVYAMFNLGVNYANGNGVDQSWDKANKWYQKAAEAGNADATFNLGVNYANGNGCEKNVAKALELCVEAAEQGCVDAAKYLADWRAEGWYGTSADLKESLKWRRVAAGGGDEESLFFLYERREQGAEGGPSDADLLQLLERFGDSDNVGALEILAEVYADGKLGVEADEAKAQEYRERVEKLELSE